MLTLKSGPAFRLRAAFAVAWCLLAAASAAGWDRGPLSDYHDRRARLVAQTGDGVIALLGYQEDDVAASVTPFHQNEQFYYLTGWNSPGAMLLIVPKTPRGPADETKEIGREILFIPPRDYQEEKWTGPKIGPDDPDAPARTGFATVESSTLFPSELLAALKQFRKVYTELTPQPESGEDCFQQDEVARLRKLAPLAQFEDVRPYLTRMRAVKSAGELALMRKAIDASMDAHLAAMKAVRPGVWEYQIAALMKYEYERRGCEWPSYPPIVGSGFFSTVLHYDADDRQMQAGDVVVMDVAGSYSGYASDITRTVPVDGHFTARQREIYEIVLGAQNAVIAAAKPGARVDRYGQQGLQSVAYNYINSHGKDLHGQPLGRYFIHGIGHSVGLNVHDPMNYDRPLEPGMVITVEPGIYIPEEKIGVRIEDMILITEGGNEILTRRLPRDPDQIERIMSQK